MAAYRRLSFFVIKLIKLRLPFLFKPFLLLSLFVLQGSSPVYPIKVPSIRKEADYQEAFVISLRRYEADLHHEKSKWDMYCRGDLRSGFEIINNFINYIAIFSNLYLLFML